MWAQSHLRCVLTQLTSQRVFSSGCGIIRLETISCELWLKFNTELPVTSIKTFCPPAMTMSRGQKRLMLSPGRAMAEPSGEQQGLIGRIQMGLHSGYWKRHCGYTAGFLTASASNLSKEASVTEWTNAVQKTQVWISSRLLGPW